MGASFEEFQFLRILERRGRPFLYRSKEKRSQLMKVVRRNMTGVEKRKVNVDLSRL